MNHPVWVARLSKLSHIKMEDHKDKNGDTRYHNVPFETVVKAYEKSAGNLSLCAKAIGIDRRTLDRWRKKYPELDAMMRDVEESLLDLCESRLMQNINDGNLTAIIFYLKTKGKHRGYIEGQIINANISTNKSMTQEEAIEFIKGLEENY